MSIITSSTESTLSTESTVSTKITTSTESTVSSDSYARRPSTQNKKLKFNSDELRASAIVTSLIVNTYLKIWPAMRANF